MDTRIHITGGCGYVGSRVAAALARKGYALTIIDKATPQERGVILPEKAEYRKADLTDPAQARESLKDAEYVLHFASNIGPLNYMWERQGEILWENTAIDAAVYPALRDAGTKLIVYSGSSMAFQHARRYPYTETDLKDTPTTTNVYGFSKLAGEYFCRAFRQQYGNPRFVIMRFHNIYGPGEDSKGSTPGDIHVIPALLEKVLRGQYPLEFIGNPEKQTRPFTYVDDAIDIVVALLEGALKGNEAVLDQDFNVASSPDATNILALGELIWKLFGDDREFKWTAEETDASRTTAERREVDIAKLRSVIDIAPGVSLEEGIRRTAEWVKTKL
ncbi:MAG: NAD(P)-dependent oxidoreductase [Patescibacteria group bacterium]